MTINNIFNHSGAAQLKNRIRAWRNGRFLAWAGLAVILLYVLGIGNHSLWG
jgi:hypothetical protein